MGRWAAGLAVVAGLLGGAACASSPERPSATAAASPTGLTYRKDIQPILASRCLFCHNASRTTAGVDLSSYAGVMRVVVPGSSRSVLVEATQLNGVMYIALGANPRQKAETIRDWIVNDDAAR